MNFLFLLPESNLLSNSRKVFEMIFIISFIYLQP